MEAMREVTGYNLFVSDGIYIMYMDDTEDIPTYIVTNEVGVAPEIEFRFKTFEEACEFFLDQRMSRI
jgi:hypothetical protein